MYIILQIGIFSFPNSICESVWFAYPQTQVSPAISLFDSCSPVKLIVGFVSSDKSGVHHGGIDTCKYQKQLIPRMHAHGMAFGCYSITSLMILEGTCWLCVMLLQINEIGMAQLLFKVDFNRHITDCFVAFQFAVLFRVYVWNLAIKSLERAQSMLCVFVNAK